MIKGTIVKGLSGFYYVWDGLSLWVCSLRGRFRIKKVNFLPGDRVEISVIDEEQKKAVIEKVEPRVSELIRPPVANVEQVMIVTALKNPEPDYRLLDRLLLMVQAAGVHPVLCFNKADLVQPSQRKAVRESYGKTGLDVILTSAKRGWGLKKLKESLVGTISVFAGPSGVGKSSLMNAMEKGLSLKTGETSEKTARGKHTTRHVELFRLPGGGLVADTPGFSQITLPEGLKRENLVRFYPEFMNYHALCKFNTCLHRDEPQCAVRDAAEAGELDNRRYQRYLEILDEVIKEERSF